MGIHGHAAPEYMATGHLYVKSDIYGRAHAEVFSGHELWDIIYNIICMLGCPRAVSIHLFDERENMLL